MQVVICNKISKIFCHDGVIESQPSLVTEWVT